MYSGVSKRHRQQCQRRHKWVPHSLLKQFVTNFIVIATFLLSQNAWLSICHRKYSKYLSQDFYNYAPFLACFTISTLAIYAQICKFYFY